jgi:hypothetical protein
MTMETPDEGSLELFEQVLAELELLQPEVTSKKMFGLPSLMIGGKPFAGLNGEEMIFKLSGEALTRALALPGAKPFDPMGGRPMKAWVQVPPEHSELWPDLAEEALHSFFAEHRA